MFKSLIIRFIEHIINPIVRLSPRYQDLVLKHCSIDSRQNSSALIGRLIRSAFWQSYWKFPVGERGDTQERLMGGARSVWWAKEYQHNSKDGFPPPKGAVYIGELDFHEANPVFEVIDNYLSNQIDTCCVIQLGASSGKDIAFFANKHPKHVFYYTDIYDSVAEYAASVHNLLNLHYLTVPAEHLDIVASLTQMYRVLIFSSGSSQYVYPENLDLMFQRLSLINGKDIVFVISEPANNSEIDPLIFNGSQPRLNFSYTHNYNYYAVKHGFRQLEWRMISPYPVENYPERKGTVHLFGMFRRDNISKTG